MEASFQTGTLLLLIAAVVAMLTRRLSLPYSVGLVTAGIVIFWGGLRGALALALALGLPVDMPMREDILAVSFAVVAFSVFVQGLTTAPLLRKMGEIVHQGLLKSETLAEKLGK